MNMSNVFTSFYYFYYYYFCSANVMTSPMLESGVKQRVDA